MRLQRALAKRWPLLAALLLASLIPGHPMPSSASATALTVAAGLRPLALGDGSPAREHLRALHAGLELPTGEVPAQGRYVHTTQQIWSARHTPEAAGGVAFEVQRWRAADRSARELRVVLPPQIPAAQIFRDFGPGEYPLGFERPSPLPEILAGQLVPPGKRHPGPEHYLRAISTMYQNHCLSNAQRAAVVRVLADTDGLQYHRAIVDRAGRPGVAVSFTGPSPHQEGQLQDVLVFHPATGDLLSHEQVLHVNAARSGVRTAVVYSYVLYLACDYTDQLPSA